jgi:hypothetical protein
MKYWEIIADKLSNAGWSWGCISAIDSSGLKVCGDQGVARELGEIFP